MKETCLSTNRWIEELFIPCPILLANLLGTFYYFLARSPSQFSLTNRHGIGVIHLVCMHERGRSMVKQNHVPSLQGGGVLILLSLYAKKSLFACNLLYFHMQGTLPYFVVFGDDFHYYFIKHLL